MSKVLFVCIENSSRSVMAEAFARELGLEASSTGIFPTSQLNPLVVSAMNEVGLDVSTRRPKRLDAEMIEKADLVVLTDSAIEPLIPKNLRKKMKKKLVTWSISDPKQEPIVGVRMIKDEIARNVKSLKI
jgi:arsenate reductase (thioredoxin)